jgi:hypothetical protein
MGRSEKSVGPPLGRPEFKVNIKMLKAILRSLGLRIENEQTHSPVHFIGASPATPRIESNAESLGAESTGGGWDIDWDNPADPLRRAILGQGPKRPFGK